MAFSVTCCGRGGRTVILLRACDDCIETFLLTRCPLVFILGTTMEAATAAGYFLRNPVQKLLKVAQILNGGSWTASVFYSVDRS